MAGRGGLVSIPKISPTSFVAPAIAGAPPYPHPDAPAHPAPLAVGALPATTGPPAGTGHPQAPSIPVDLCPARVDTQAALGMPCSLCSPTHSHRIASPIVRQHRLTHSGRSQHWHGMAQAPQRR